MTNGRSTSERPPALLFGIPLDDVTMPETIEVIDDLVRRGRADGTTHQVATVNVDFIVNALADEDVCRILQRSDLCLADGMPVVWGARLAGMPLRDRVTGVDLVQLLARSSAERGWRIHFFGSAAGIAEAAARKLVEAHPGARISAEQGPQIGPRGETGPTALAAIEALNVDVLCVALGNPKQEWFINAHREQLHVPVLIGVGGSLDMIVGHRRRAPRWMQRAGLEWIFRAIQEPQRLGRRYARDAFVYLPRLVSYIWTQRRHRRGWQLVRVSPTGLAAAPSPKEGSPVEPPAVGPGHAVTVDLRGAPRLGSSAVASIVGLVRQSRRRGGQVAVRGATGSVADQLSRVAVDMS